MTKLNPAATRNQGLTDLRAWRAALGGVDSVFAIMLFSPRRRPQAPPPEADFIYRRILIEKQIAPLPESELNPH
jgi:hypothetical protein